MTSSNCKYSLVLTHDIDVLSLHELPWRNKTLWGFAYKCLKAAVLKQPNNRNGILQRMALAGLSARMPLVKLGLMSDPWAVSLNTMLEIEKRYNVRSTLFFLPFPKQAGLRPDGTSAPPNRAAYYNLCEYSELISGLERGGWEIAVHGIDSYRSLDAARNEFQKIQSLTHKEKMGVRIHWLYHLGKNTWEILAQAGYTYDATFGWNDEIGFPDERLRPFRPLNGKSFTVLPLNIQDVALFEYAGWSESEAWQEVSALLDKAARIGATVTVLWHNNSFAAPRYWGTFYERLIERALSDGALILRAIDAVGVQSGGVVYE